MLRGTSGTHRHGRARTALRIFSALAIVASLMTAVTVTSASPAAAARTPGELVHYDFSEGAGATVGDSGSGAPMDLTISDPGNVDWVAGGGLTVNSSTAIISSGPATKVIDAVKASGQMTVEAWVTPAPGEQSGPARLVANAPNPNVRNFMLGQGAWSSLPDDTFASRFRTSNAFRGTPTMFTPAGSATSALSHVVLTRSTSGLMTLYVNGVAEASDTITGTTANWNTTYPLTLANVADGSRPWLGTFCLVAIYDTALTAGEISDNHTVGCNQTPNTNPVLDPITDQTNGEGDTVNLDVDATDPDDDTLTYDATGLPDGLDIDPTTGLITGDLSQTAATGSPHTVDINVTDNRGGTDTTSFTWSINPVNVAPVLDPVVDQTDADGDTVTLDIDATDPDGDTLVYTATGLPPGLDIDPATGEITGAIDPGAATGSPYTVDITADDQNGATDTAPIDWTVTTAPIGPTALARYDFSDGAGSTVTDSGSGAPTDLTIGNPGNVNWVPGGGLSVDASTTIISTGPATKVIDAVKASDQMTVEVWVTPAPGEQSGPARIVSNAPNPRVRNFMLGQGAWSSLPDDTFASRFRTTNTLGGTPTLFTPAGSTNTTLTHVVLTRTSSGQMTLYVNGVPEATDTITGTTTNWNTTYPLTLANIADGSRPWLGTLCLVSIYDTALTAGQISDNHTAGCNQTPNTDPVLDPIGDQTNDEGDTVLVDVDATDPDGDPLTYDATGLPDGLDIDPTTGEITGDLSQTSATGSPHTADINVTDNRGGTDTLSFTWTVDDIPLPPIAVDDAYGTPFDTPLTVGAGSGLLANDTSEDLFSAVLEQDVGTGTLVLAPDGSFTYTPDAGFSGLDTFTYRATNGSGPSDPATVRITVTQGGTPGSPPRIVTGAVTFTRQVVATTVDQTHMAVGGDLDGDGDTDLAATDYVNGRVLWFENDGTGSFRQRTVDNDLDGAYPLHVDDLDADGDLDLLAAGYDIDTFTWYENNGTASWTRRVIDSAAGGAHSIVTSDLDDDGDLDLVASNQLANTVTWYENDGAEGFTRFTVDSSAKGAKRAETADIDGDGHLDIVATSNSDDTVAWYENDGNEAFVEHTIDAAADGGYYVAPADLDGDGDIDVLAALQVADAVVWYENDGAGGFAKRVIDDSVLGARSVIASDIDGDGDVDAVSASPDDDTVSWYENDGTGDFSARLVDLGANGPYGVFALDFDHDGETDLVSASRDDDSITLHLSTRAHTAYTVPGGTLTVDATELSTVDPDHGAAELTYTVDVPPVSGTLTLDGVVVPAGGVFTQADVNRGAVTFTHTLGSGPVDTFRFSVTNGEPGTQPLSGSFTIIATDPADELVHLPLDEGGGSSAGDTSGHGNNGTLSGGATFEADSPDGSASAVRLDGATGAIHLPAIDVTGSGLTAALWFKADSFATWDARLISKASGTAASQHVFMISTIRVGNEFRLRARLRIGGDTTTFITSGPAVTTGEWRHAALTHDGAIARLYLDGIEVASAVLAGAIDTDPSLPVAIGAQPPGAGGRHFDGLVDDVHILQRALTRSEVAVLAGQGG